MVKQFVGTDLASNLNVRLAQVLRLAQLRLAQSHLRLAQRTSTFHLQFWQLTEETHLRTFGDRLGKLPKL